MSFLNMSPLGLTEDEYILVRDLILRKCGLYFDGSRKDLLEASIMVRVKESGAKGFMDYFTLLDEDTSGNGEFSRLIELLTVKETFFMRDSDQFDALRNVILPEVIQKREKKDRSINIWSAACSTGEEPYSIAMILLDILPSPDQWNIRILATDISGMALKSARKGIYNDRSVRGLRDEDRSRFFEKRKNDHHIMSNVKSMVEFSQLNLIQDNFPIPNGRGWDIVFCRNVIIYFKKETVRQVIRNINKCLEKDGFLFTGHSEILRYITDEFSSINFGNSFIYKKNGCKEERLEEEGIPRKNGQIARTMRSYSKELTHSTRREKKIGQPLSKPVKRREIKQEKVEARAVVPVEVKRDRGPEEYVDLAVTLANQGKHDEAIGHCRRSIAEDPLFTDAYFLAGLIFKSKEDPENAVKKFRKVLFLDSDYFLARIYLADLHMQLGDGHKKVRIEYHNIIRGLERNPQKDLGRFAGGFTSETLIQVCQEKLSRMEQLK